ncbi:MAG: hypothetical protein AB7H88_09020 [Vicinamibacterales bacterium]
MRLALLLLVPALVAQGPQLSEQKARAFEAKVAAVMVRGAAERAAPARTVLPEDELNSFFRFRAGDVVPEGIAEPRVGLGAEGRVTGQAIVDLDVVRRTRSTGGWFDPRSYLTGRLPVAVTGVLAGKGGQATFVLERAEISGVPIPKSLLQELVTYYTRSPAFPGGVSLDEPFPLPARIDALEVRPGEAIVVQ